ncbi:MAG: TetR/AcrR family transcriptional regulator [Chloroflexota bacterium]|nr:MAG: TetR/AcrR family transcriptional regulator [Chloroflexota bacterium]
MTTLNRSKIVAVAQELFSQRGYANTSIEDIANVLSVRKGAIHYHVSRKIDLLVEIVRSLLVPITEDIIQLAETPLDPPTKLRRAIGIHVAGLLSSETAARVFFEERRELPPGAQQDFGHLEDSIRDSFERIVSAGIADRSFRQQDPKLAVLHVLALCNWPYRWFRPNDPLTLEEVIASIQAQALWGLVASDSPARVSN